MAKLQIKKSNETGKVPQPGDLDWGELALNYADGKLFYKKNGTNTVELLNPPDTNTVTRLRGTTGGAYTSGDLTLLAGTNITITQSGSDYTIASAGGADPTKLPLAGGTLTGALSITDATQSTSTSTGALTVTGGVGIAKNLYVGETLSVSLNASIYGITIGRGGGAVASNTAVGASALAANTTGAYNVAFGQSSLAANTTGNFNTAIAREALASNTTGVHNTSVGHDNLYGNTSGSYNTALGSWALQSNTTASYNTAVGYQSGYSQTTGGNNTSFGATSLYTTTTGTLNTAIGQSSLYSNTTGGSNTALGLQALFSNTTASNNTAVGYQAGYSNTTGTDNISIGRLAGYGTTTTSNNIAIGYNTLSQGAGSANNVVVGNEAQRYVGSYVVAIGHQALASSTASNNTAVGYRAGYSNTTAVGLVALGNQAALANTTGSYNIFIGDRAGYGASGNITGGGNTVIGTNAGASLTTGAFNTFVGAEGSVVQGSGGLITTGSKNTILGPYNGNQGGVDIRTASNYIVLSDGDGNPRIVVNGSGNTGVGNPAPTEKLDVAGNIKHTGLTMTAGTNVDQIYTHQQNITLTTGWQDTGVNAAELATGSYIVQVTNVQDNTVGGQQYEEYYTGIMSWFAGNTNSNMSDEIALHRAGHAPNDGTIFLRVLRTYGADTDDLKLQIAGTTNNTAAYQYTFKFRRLI